MSRKKTLLSIDIIYFYFYYYYCSLSLYYHYSHFFFISYQSSFISYLFPLRNLYLLRKPYDLPIAYFYVYIYIYIFPYLYYYSHFSYLLSLFIYILFSLRNLYILRKRYYPPITHFFYPFPSILIIILIFPISHLYSFLSYTPALIQCYLELTLYFFPPLPSFSLQWHGGAFKFSRKSIKWHLLCED